MGAIVNKEHMEIQQPTYNPTPSPASVEPKPAASSVRAGPPTPPAGGFGRAGNSSSPKTKILVIGTIILTVVLTIGAYTLGVRKNKEKNPAYLDPVTVLINKLFPPSNPTGTSFEAFPKISPTRVPKIPPGDPPGSIGP
jgi:hypothetical protein